MPRGGARPNSGPKKGSKNIRTVKRQKAIADAHAAAEKILGKGAFTGNAVAFMATVYKSPDAPMELRCDMARACAPYESAKKNEHSWEGEGIPIRLEGLNLGQLEQLLARIETAIAGDTGGAKG